MHTHTRISHHHTDTDIDTEHTHTHTRAHTHLATRRCTVGRGPAWLSDSMTLRTVLDVAAGTQLVPTRRGSGRQSGAPTAWAGVRRKRDTARLKSFPTRCPLPQGTDLHVPTLWQNIKKRSERYQKGIKKVSERYQKGIKKVSKRYQKGVKKVSKRYQKGIKKVSKRYQCPHCPHLSKKVSNRYRKGSGLFFWCRGWCFFRMPVFLGVVHDTFRAGIFFRVSFLVSKRYQKSIKKVSGCFFGCRGWRFFRMPVFFGVVHSTFRAWIFFRVSFLVSKRYQKYQKRYRAQKKVSGFAQIRTPKSVQPNRANAPGGSKGVGADPRRRRCHSRGRRGCSGVWVRRGGSG